MVRYRSSNKLTQEQRREIAYLVNAGVRGECLAESYNVSIHTIRSISHQRRRWLDEKDIVKTPDERFRFAQRVRGDDSLSYEAKSYIDCKVLEPFAAEAVSDMNLDFLTGIEKLLGRIFDSNVFDSERMETRKKERVARLIQHAVDALRGDSDEARIYETRRDAKKDLKQLVRETNLSSEENERNRAITKEIDKALKTLNWREREIIKLRFGVSDDYVYTLDECGKIFHVCRSRAGQIESRAIRKLQNPRIRNQLRELVDNPPPQPPFPEGDSPFNEARVNYDSEERRSIEEFYFSVRTRKALKELGVQYAGDLAYITKQELSSVRNVGETTFEEIRRKILEPFGLEFRKD